MRRVFLWAGGLFLLLLCGLLVVVLVIDLGRFKNPMLAAASEVLGRSVSMDGELSVRIGKRVLVEAEGLRLASVDWAEAENLLEIDRLSLDLDTLSLLSDEIVVHSVALSGLRASLEESEEGADNYTLPFFEEPSEAATPGVRLVHLEARDIEVSYTTPALPQSLLLAVARLDLVQEASDLVLELLGSLNGEALAAQGTIGSMDDLLAATNVDFELDGNLGEVQFTALGTVDDLTEPRRPQLRADLTGPDARYLLGLLGLEPITSGPLRFEVEVQPGADKVTLAAAGEFGEFQLRADASTTDLQRLPEAELSADAAGPSLANLGTFLGLPDVPEEPFDLAVRAALVSEHLQVETLQFAAGDAVVDLEADLPAFPSLAGGTAKLAVNGPHIGHFTRLLGLPGRMSGPFSIDGTLVQGEVEGDLQLSLEAEALRGTVQATVSNQADLTGTNFSAGVEGADASLLAAALDLQGIPKQPFAVSLEAGMEAEALRIDRSTIRFGRDQLSITGVVGRDPLSAQTQLRVSSALSDLAGTLADFGLEAPETLPTNALTLTFDVSRVEAATKIIGQLGADPGLSLAVDGRVGDSFTPGDAGLTFDLAMDEVAALLPADQLFGLSGALDAQGQVFFEDERLRVGDLDVKLGSASFQGAVSTPLDAPFTRVNATIELSVARLSELLPELNEQLALSAEVPPVAVSGLVDWLGDGIETDGLQISLGEAELVVDGALAFPVNEGVQTLEINAGFPSLRELDFLSPRPLPEEPLALAVVLTGAPQWIEVVINQLDLGKSSLTARAEALLPETEADRPSVSLTLRSPRLDLHPYVGYLAEEPAPEAATTVDDGRVIPDIELPLELLTVADVDVDIDIAEVLVADRTLEDARLRGTLLEGNLDVEDLSLTGPNGTLTAELEVESVPQGADLRVQILGDT